MELLKKIRYLVAILLAMTPLLMPASPIDAAAAREAASRFVNSHTVINSNASPTPLRLVYTAPSVSKRQAVDYYVFDVADGNGFVIVAGDDRARQVLAYGDHSIDMTSVPGNVQWLLDQYAEQMEYLFNHPDAKPSRQTQGSESVVPQMLTTTWGQRTPYRDQCPQVEGKPCVTGCVATSMAQVMNYWRYPSQLPAVPAYVTETLRLNVPALPPADVPWDLMQDSYREGSYTEEQGSAVALLMRYCGQACKMDYTIPSSAAWSVDQLKAFKLFGYDKNASFVTRVYYSDEQWHAMIQEDLRAGRPVIYSGKPATASPHNFVLDGYDGSKYHVNWGWDGLYDGYYELDALNGGGYRPTQDHSMLHGVCPATEEFDSDYKVDGIYYNQTTETTVAVTCRNNGYNSYSGNVVIPEQIAFNGLCFKVTAIADDAFRDCDQLHSVQIPNTVATIGVRAFQRAGLDSITIPNSVTSLGTLAFEYCPNLSYAEIGNGIKKIENAVFKNCSRLTAVKLSDSLKSIGPSAFFHSGLERISIPSSVVRIDENAFGGCNHLTEVHTGSVETWCGINFLRISSNPLAQAHYLYVGGEKVTRLNLPSRVRNYALAGIHLDQLTIDAGTLQSIGSQAFYNSEIGRLDIMDVGAWLALDLNGQGSNPINQAGQVFFDGSDFPGYVSIPATMTRIKADCFRDCMWLTRISIPSSIIEIGNDAFNGCHNLVEVHINDLESWCGITFGNLRANPLVDAHYLYCAGERLDDITLPESVDTIKPYAFASIALDHLAINAGFLHSVGDGAFYYSQIGRLDITNTQAWLSIEFNGTNSNPIDRARQVYFDGIDAPGTIVIPSTMTKIGKSAFNGSTWLKRIYIPSSVNEIEADAFAGCSSLQEVHIEDLEAWCGITFGNMSANPLSCARHLYLGEEPLTDLTLPAGVTDVAPYAFSCIVLDHMTINAGPLRTIGTGAFYQSSIRRVDVTDAAAWFSIDFGEDANPIDRAGLRYIDGEELTGDLVLPSTMTRIGTRAFSKCPWLKSITIPCNIVEIGEDAFKSRSWLFNSVTIDDLGAWCNIRFANEESCPLRGMDQVYIDGQNVCGHDLVLPDTVTSISNYAFSGLNINHLALPPSVISIGDGAFRYLMNLTELEIPSSVERVGESAFANCGKMGSLSCHEGLKVIGDSAFYYCSELASLALPGTLAVIGDYAFGVCMSLPRVMVPDGVTSLGRGAFAACSGLTSAVIGKGVTVIPEDLFFTCGRLSDVQMPESIVEIGRGAFNSCYNLKAVSWPDSLRTIGDFAFSFSELESVNLGGMVTTVGDGAFANCHGLKEAIIGDQVTALGQSVFHSCMGLETAVIGDGVQQLPAYTFYYCSRLNEVTIGSEIDSIMAEAFSYCYDLKTITCKAKVPPVFVTNNYFQPGTYRNGTLYVPLSSVNAYKNAFIWKEFNNIMGVCMGHVQGDMNCDEEVNIADVNTVVSAILDGDGDPDLDMNGDGEVNIADINAILDLILAP